ncbi:hypothetical protein NUACC21_78690 [Scytonema sp. NUACC21]
MGNLHVLHNEKNKGLCVSRNRGIAHARGEIIVFTDDDVSLFPDSLDELVKLYDRDPDITAIWGCVYQYGGDWIQGTSTSGTGSFMSFRRAIFKRFRFDTNLRYFNSYACDEHEFMRRIQKNGYKIVHAEYAKANHFNAPSKERMWRGLGGDLNYLYENLKSGSILQYYKSLIIAVLLLPKSLFKKSEFDKQIHQHPYKQVLETPKRILVFIKHGQFSIALQWLFYILIDIPFRAKTKEIFESIVKSHSTT